MDQQPSSEAPEGAVVSTDADQLTGVLPVVVAPPVTSSMSAGGQQHEARSESRGDTGRPGSRGLHPGLPTNVYRARRPAAAALVIVPSLLVASMLIRGLMAAAFGHQYSLSGVLASSFALAALPLLVVGLYGLITGAAYGAHQWGFTVWARPPLAYLLVGGFFLFVAAISVT